MTDKEKVLERYPGVVCLFDPAISSWAVYLSNGAMLGTYADFESEAWSAAARGLEQGKGEDDE